MKKHKPDIPAALLDVRLTYPSPPARLRASRAAWPLP